jgi:hypothetical protein
MESTESVGNSPRAVLEELARIQSHDGGGGPRSHRLTRGLPAFRKAMLAERRLLMS